MKKFKLIKEYPGSPKLGHIICCNDFTHNGIDRYPCSEYPEFWEEVVEKDYKILKLALARPVKHEIRDFEDYSEDYIKGLLACKGNYIHSVKRLSDGEVFTVGDKLKTGVIKEIFLPNNISIKEVTFHVTKDDEDIYLSEAIKLKQPLFTTEDGVDVYGRNHPNLYYVNLKYYKYGIDYANSLYDADLVNYKYFSTKEKAEEYILMNKPCLSLNDLVNSSFDDEDVYEELVTKVKLKLK